MPNNVEESRRQFLSRAKQFGKAYALGSIAESFMWPVLAGMTAVGQLDTRQRAKTPLEQYFGRIELPLRSEGTFMTSLGKKHWYNFANVEVNGDAMQQLYAQAEAFVEQHKGRILSTVGTSDNDIVSYTLQEEPTHDTIIVIVPPKTPDPAWVHNRFPTVSNFPGWTIKGGSELAVTRIRLKNASEINPRDPLHDPNRRGNFFLATEVFQNVVLAQNNGQPIRNGQEEFCNSFGIAAGYAIAKLPFSEYYNWTHGKGIPFKGVTLPFYDVPESIYNQFAQIPPVIS